MASQTDLQSIPDDELLRSLFDALKKSRYDEADLVARIGEVDARRLYARQAAPSMYVWCTERLHLSEHEAYLRITVARASRRHSVLLTMLREGKLHLSGIAKLVPHLTADNRQELLRRATHKTKREVQELVAALSPRPPAPAAVRRLPQRRRAARSELRPGTVEGAAVRLPSEVGPAVDAEGASAGEAGACLRQTCTVAHEARGRGSSDAASGAAELGLDRVRAGAPRTSAERAVVEPVAPARFRVRFDASADLKEKLERLQALMRSTVPDGDLGTLIEQAVTEKLERLEARRFAKTKTPRKRLATTDTTPRSRHIPAAVKRFVEKRDAGRCTYRDQQGRRCSKRHDLEYHHRVPFGLGGHHAPENLALLCRAHNRLLAERDYGKEWMARHRSQGSRVTDTANARMGPEGGAHPGG